MEDHLQNIRTEYSKLDPTKTYNRLSEMVTSDVIKEGIDYESMMKALKQLHELSRHQGFGTNETAIPPSAADMLRQGYKEWFHHLQKNHEDMGKAFDIVKDAMLSLPDKDYVAAVVAKRIQENYPEFCEEYHQHQQWLKVNQERLDHQEQGRLQEETDKSRDQSVPTR